MLSYNYVQTFFFDKKLYTTNLFFRIYLEHLNIDHLTLNLNLTKINFVKLRSIFKINFAQSHYYMFLETVSH